MKTLLLIAVFISGTAMAQTNVIAAKSHSSNTSIDLGDPDNFGEYIMPRQIQSVAYFKEDCIIETYASYWNENDLEYDTICNHPFLQPSSFDLARMKAMYPEETKFEGFDKIEKANKKATKKLKNEKKQGNSNGLIIFLIGGLLCLIYLFVPKLKPSHS